MDRRDTRGASTRPAWMVVSVVRVVGVASTRPREPIVDRWVPLASPCGCE